MLGLAGLVLQVVGLAALKFGWSMAPDVLGPMMRTRDMAASPRPSYARKGPEGGDR